MFFLSGVHHSDAILYFAHLNEFVKDELHDIFNLVEIMFCFDVIVVPLIANGSVRGLIRSTY